MFLHFSNILLLYRFKAGKNLQKKAICHSYCKLEYISEKKKNNCQNPYMLHLLYFLIMTSIHLKSTYLQVAT